MKKKLLILLLSMAMFVTMMPTMAFAETTDNVVATIGNVTYTNLQAAVNNASNTDVIKLQKDITLTDRVDADVNATYTIDLGGKTITPTATCGNGSAFNVVKGDVTIKNGTIDAKGITSIECDPITVRSGAKATLVDGLSIVINSRNGACAYAFDGGEITIEGGNYENQTTEVYEYNSSFTGMLVNQANVSSKLVTIKGGTFKGQNPATGDDSGNVTTFIADGYVSTGEDNVWTVSQINVAQIGSAIYPTVQAAIDAVKDGETITLSKNLTLTERIDANKNAAYTIDLNGKTITPTVSCGNGSAFNIVKGTVTIKNGTIDAKGITSTECDAITVRDGARAILTDGLHIIVNSKNGACAYAFADGKIEIKSGIYENQTAEIYEYKTAFKGMLVNQANLDLTTEQLISITGGTFKGQNPASGDDSWTTGSFVASGYKAIQEDNTKAIYKVVPDTQYTVTFYGNGGTPATSTDVVYRGETTTAPATAPTKTGYKVAGWYTSATPATTAAAWDFNTAITTNTNLYAKWTPVKYNVAFAANGGTGTMTAQELTYDTAAALKANTFAKNGYVFKGWNTVADGTGTSYADGASVKNLASTENATVTLYAQWEKQIQVDTKTGTAEVDATDKVKIDATNKTATRSLDATEVANIVATVKNSNTTTTAIKIGAKSNATGAANVTTSSVEFPVDFAEKIAETKASINTIEIETNLGTMSFDYNAFANIAAAVKEAKGTTVTVTIAEAGSNTLSTNGTIYQDYTLTVTTVIGSKTVQVTDFGNGTETITVTTPAGLAGKTIGCLYVTTNADKSETFESVACTQNALKTTVTFVVNHNSTFRLLALDDANAALAAQEKPVVEAATIIQKKLVAYKNGKIKVSWKAAEGTTVGKYEVYRSTKRNGTYKKVGEVTSARKFVNAKNLKKGRRYYYKVRGAVQLQDGTTAYTQWSNIRYIKCKKTIKTSK